MSTNLDKSWVYDTKVNISEIEKIGRNNAYRQGIEDFKNKVMEEINKSEYFSSDHGGFMDEALNIIKELKK